MHTTTAPGPGQAWAILGFAQAATWLGDEFLEPANAAAEWWCAHTPEGSICPWDFSAGDGPSDTSAAAIAVRALLALGDMQGETRLVASAHDTLRVLCDQHLAHNVTSLARGRLIDGCLNYPERAAITDELIWGSWFLLESLLALAEPDPHPSV